MVILAILFIFFYIQRNRKLHPQRDAVEIDPDPIVAMSENDPLRLGDDQPYTLNRTLTNSGAEALSTTTVDQSSPQMTKALPPRANHIAHLSPTALDIPTALVPSPPANIPISAVVQPSTQHPNSAAPGIHVTPQETQLLNSLYSRNVPAAEIAAMIEAMREARDASPNRVEGSSGGVAHGDPGSEPVDPPPEYDFKGK